MERENESEIIGMSVPDSEVEGWIRTLQAGGFSQEEIDSIMSHLNETYLAAKEGPEFMEEYTQAVEYLEKKRGHKMANKDKAILRELVKQVQRQRLEKKAEEIE
jgi:hypothetical protein